MIRPLLSQIRAFSAQTFSAFVVLWILMTPRRENSVDRLAGAEINRLKRHNVHFQNLRRGGGIKWIIGFIDSHKAVFISLLLILVAAPLAMVNAPYVCPAGIPLWAINAFDAMRRPLATSGDTSNYHSIMATIQATVMSLIVPITIAVHDLFQKEKKNKGVIITFIIKETRAHLIIASTIAFLSWIGFVEFLRISYPYLRYSNFTSAVECVWFVVNLLLIAYFMFASIELFNRGAINMAFSRIIIARAYSDEMWGYIRRNIFLNLSRSREGSDEE